MKYTTVFTPRWDSGSSQSSATISLCAGKGSSTGDYISLTDCNPDDKALTDFKTYTQACIYGVSCKWVFAEPTTVDSSPVSLQLSYSPNVLLNPQLDAVKMQSQSTYQIMPCNQNRSVTRYFPLAYTKQKLGIDFFDTDEYTQFGIPDSILYSGQLDGGHGPSLHFKVDRNSTGATSPACRLQITYYVRFRGTKGISDLS